MSRSGGFWMPAGTSTSSLSREEVEATVNRDGDNDHQSAALLMGHRSSSRMALAQQRLLLPIHTHKRQILYAVENFGVTVLVAETGAGKSTQIAQYLVETGGWADHDFQVVVTQPRRIAAMTLAQRVADEMTTPLGNRVGYAVRFDEQRSSQTQILFCTDGLLLREAALYDPFLSKYSVVIVDEAHERSLNSDAVLGLLKQIRRQRTSLRIVVCSATIDAQAFCDFFVGKPKHRKGHKSTMEKSTREDDDNAAIPGLDRGTIISVDGRQFPVNILYLAKPARDYIQTTVETTYRVHQANQQSPGDILCFLPTGEDVDRAVRLADEHFYHINSISKDGPRVELMPLYGALPLNVQERIFEKRQHQSSKNWIRRVIFATNIAETSVTVPNVEFVIDAGLVKLPYFDPATALQRLIVTPISQASARQRAGRSGRVKTGQCYRLYTESYFLKHMHAQTSPEILRTDLSTFILTLKAIGVDNILAFDLMDVPSVESLSHGLETLYALGAIDLQTALTPVGMNMATFPTDPYMARMLLESIKEKCSWEVLGVAAVVQLSRNIWNIPASNRSSTSHAQQQKMLDFQAVLSDIADPSGDHVSYANLLSELDDHGLSKSSCQERFVNYMAAQRAMEIRQQLGRFLKPLGRIEAAGSEPARSQAIRRCVTAGYFVNVAKLANNGHYYTLRKRVMVTPHNNSVYSQHPSAITSEYIVFGESMDGTRGGIELTSVSTIEAKWLRDLAPHYWE